MAVPKRRQSKQRSRTRRANWKLTEPNLVRCKQCHELKLQHKVCKECGYYAGKEVLKLNSK
ncbi:MAG: 50S ribosomal protein L32 [Clostridiales bacterium]